MLDGILVIYILICLESGFIRFMSGNVCYIYAGSIFMRYLSFTVTLFPDEIIPSFPSYNSPHFNF